MSKTAQAVVAGHIFDGAIVHRKAAVVIEGENIARVVPRVELPEKMPVRAMPEGAWLAPGFV
ncbi:MAG: N-acetylglucosamine-6-phosphate deacetylase, partial [Xanthobacteraceae bacterium]